MIIRGILRKRSTLDIFEALHIKSSMPPPKTVFQQKIIFSSRRSIAWPKYTNTSFCETRLASRRFWVNPFRTAVPFRGQTTPISSSLSPKRDGGSKGVKEPGHSRKGFQRKCATSIVERAITKEESAMCATWGVERLEIEWIRIRGRKKRPYRRWLGRLYAVTEKPSNVRSELQNRNRPDSQRRETNAEQKN